MSLPRFYPIFDDVKWLERLLPLGIKLVQLRIKDKPRDEIADQIKRAKVLCAQHGTTLIINDYWDIAIETGCDWVHLGQEDLDTADTAALRAADIKFGLSTHDRAELDRALSLAPDYIALGPIYPTILKKMKWTEQGLEKLTEWKSLIGEIPLIAIGGMSVERAQGAFGAGANVVSAVTDITLHENPKARIAQWLEVTK